MKKIILTLVAIFAFGFANAQDGGFSQGDKFLEGSFSFRTSEALDSWSLNPSMGYMLDDQWAIGGRLNFGGSEDFVGNKKSNFGATAFGRYYFLTLGADKKFNAFGELGLGYSALTNDPIVGDKSTDGALNANISLGINYFFTSHWAATFTLANVLNYNSYTPENGDNTSDLTVNVNLFNNIFAQPQFGLLYKW